MNLPYSLTWYGRPIANGEHATFSGAIARVRDGIARGVDARGYVLQNNDRADEDDCGLTDEELDIFNDALFAPLDAVAAVRIPVCTFNSLKSSAAFVACNPWG